MKKKLNTVLIFDEGDAIFSRHSEQSMLGYPTVSIQLTTSRASGIGAVVMSHQPHLVLTSLRSEAYTRVIFNLSDSQDAHYMAQACSLNREEEAFISKLPNYHAIVRTRRCERPLVIRIPNYADLIRSKPVINSEQAQTKIKELSKHVIPRKPDCIEVKESNNNLSKETLFDVDSVNLLDSTFKHPFRTTTGHFQGLGFSASKGNKAVKTLEENGLIEKVKVKTRIGRGGNANILELTKAGLERLGKKSQSFGKGGIKHSYYAWRVSQYHVKRGKRIRREYKGCDVAVLTPEGLIAFEISISQENLNENLSRNKTNNFLKTVFIFESQAEIKRAEQKIQSKEQVEMQLIDDFLEDEK